MIIQLSFIRFNNKNFNNKREFILLLYVYLIKFYKFLNNYIVSYISFLKCKILILLKVLSRFFFNNLLYVFRTLITIIIKMLNQNFDFFYNFIAFEILKPFFLIDFVYEIMSFIILLNFQNSFFIYASI